MEILYLLIPVTVLLAFLVLGIFAWALKAGQFESIEREGERILEDDADAGPVGTARSPANEADRPPS